MLSKKKQFDRPQQRNYLRQHMCARDSRFFFGGQFHYPLHGEKARIGPRPRGTHVSPRAGSVGTTTALQNEFELPVSVLSGN